MEVKETATTMVYMIDDRTGPWVKVQRWIEDQSTPVEPSERSACREGMYVKVIGNIKTFNDQKSVTAFSVCPIEDFNEVTHHLSEVVVGHLAATKGAPVVSQSAVHCKFFAYEICIWDVFYEPLLRESLQVINYASGAHAQRGIRCVSVCLFV